MKLPKRQANRTTKVEPARRETDSYGHDSSGSTAKNHSRNRLGRCDRSGNWNCAVRCGAFGGDASGATGSSRVALRCNAMCGLPIVCGSLRSGEQPGQQRIGQQAASDRIRSQFHDTKHHQAVPAHRWQVLFLRKTAMHAVCRPGMRGRMHVQGTEKRSENGCGFVELQVVRGLPLLRDSMPLPCAEVSMGRLQPEDREVRVV